MVKQVTAQDPRGVESESVARRSSAGPHVLDGEPKDTSPGPLITSARRLSLLTARARSRGERVGFVPTMGALHGGHLSLIEAARRDSDTVVVSVFVNPTQFAPGEDLASYPRDLDSDVRTAVAAGSDIVFAPRVAEIYPPGFTTSVEVTGLTEVLEGEHRPGHFRGVTTVVAKLLCIVGECEAYFGEKDFQQLTVVRRMVEDLSMSVGVVACPTVREADGLALSSRNVYLDTRERSAATVLWRSLQAGRQVVLSGASDPSSVRGAMVKEMVSEPLATPDYLAVVDPATLREPCHIDREVRLLVAARIGHVRLLDNVAANPG